MKAALVTHHTVICPSCHGEAFRVFLDIDPSVHGWSNISQRACGECGQRYKVTVVGDTVDLVTLDIRDTPGWLLLMVAGSEPPVFMIVDHPFYARYEDDTPEEREGHTRYFVEEHTCPTNLVRVEAILTAGDADPHGVLEFVAHRPKPPVMEEDENYMWDDWVKIFPELEEEQ